MSSANEPITAIEVVADNTAASRCEEGFLRMRRLVLRNRRADGSTSAPYACDVVSRRHVDAVAAVIWERAPGGTVRVALKTGIRPPILLRRGDDGMAGDAASLLLAEIVAGVIEDEPGQRESIERRAAEECAEEAGYDVAPESVRALGGPLHPSPGVTDELVHFRAIEASLDGRGDAPGDGSPMEEGGGVVVMPLREAIRRCRDGTFPDMKTEVALLRLSDQLGYVPALDCFLDDLDPALKSRRDALPPTI